MLPELILHVLGETATGEPLDRVEKEEETLRAGKEFIVDEIEKEGMVGDWDRLESRSVLDSNASFPLSPCSDLVVVISWMISFSSSCEHALLDRS
jgi:hypothetical protein